MTSTLNVDETTGNNYVTTEVSLVFSKMEIFAQKKQPHKRLFFLSDKKQTQHSGWNPKNSI